MFWVFVFRIPYLWIRSHFPARPKHYLAVAAIAKNEGRYFDEWIKWHKKLGVEKFYIIDNDSADNTEKILQPYVKSGLVEYKKMSGPRMQIPAYDYILRHHRRDARWIAFIDLDEFIVPKKHRNIQEYLKQFENASAVEINWLCYGSGGAKKRTTGDVMKRFRAHSCPEHIENRTVKTIVNPMRTAAFMSVHRPILARGYSVDANGNPGGHNFRSRAPAAQDTIRINHYAVKSYEEFLDKRSRGRARALDKRGDNYFKKFDLNDVTD
jgi:hypothetical protein